MNHNFSPTISDSTVCIVCRRTEIEHSNRATCEACGNSGTMDVVYGSLLCQDCATKERAAQDELKRNAMDRVKASRESMSARVEIEKAKQIDQSVQIIQDIYNAETVSIVEIKAAIDSDETITEKHYELARAIDDRFKHFQELIESAREAIRENESKQRAIQQYYNDLANRLRAEQREQIKLKDVNYKPIEKKIVKPRSVNVKKFDRGELIRIAGQVSKEFPSIPSALIMSNLQNLSIAKNMTLEQAATVLKGMFGG